MLAILLLSSGSASFNFAPCVCVCAPPESRSKKTVGSAEAVDVADHLQMWPLDRYLDTPPK